MASFLPWRKMAAECLGTCMLVLIAKGTALSLSSDPEAPGVLKNLPGSLAGGMGVMMGILVTGGVSGGHINPAVSIAMMAVGKMPWKEVPGYLVGQIAGAGLGSFLILLNYSEAFQNDIHPSQVMGSLPGLSDSFGYLVLDQFLATFLLLMCITAVVDQGHQPGGLLVGLSVLGIGLGFGMNAGAGINPAVDAIPRILGILWEGSTENQGWFWIIPLVVPFFGAVAATMTYRLVIGFKPSPLENHDGTCCWKSGNA